MQDIEVAIDGDSIKLGQFLKLALAITGGEAKELIAGGEVAIDGEVVTQRGHAVPVGARVEVQGVRATVVAGSGEEDDYFDEATADDDFDPEKWRNL